MLCYWATFDITVGYVTRSIKSNTLIIQCPQNVNDGNER